jgi:hypothetical protein
MMDVSTNVDAQGGLIYAFPDSMMTVPRSEVINVYNEYTLASQHDSSAHRMLTPYLVLVLSSGQKPILSLLAK